MVKFKHLVKSAFRELGFELRRYHPASSSAAQLKAMLGYHDINLLLDIGANTGQFGLALRDIGYEGRIVSFEPLLAAYTSLCARAKNDPRWEVSSRTAVGSEEGEVEIHVAGNSVSSSVLDMLDMHVNAAPESRYVGREMVPIHRLDSLANKYIDTNSRTFVKIDTQGYEDRVLKGAQETLKRIKGIQIELSLVPLYSGQKLYWEISEDLMKNQFTLWATAPAFVDPRSGRLLQIDAVFFRS